jgi:hypothetical protein
MLIAKMRDESLTKLMTASAFSLVVDLRRWKWKSSAAFDRDSLHVRRSHVGILFNSTVIFVVHMYIHRMRITISTTLSFLDDISFSREVEPEAIIQPQNDFLCG